MVIYSYSRSFRTFLAVFNQIITSTPPKVIPTTPIPQIPQTNNETNPEIPVEIMTVKTNNQTITVKTNNNETITEIKYQIIQP
eukprot:UN03654